MITTCKPNKGWNPIKVEKRITTILVRSVIKSHVPIYKGNPYKDPYLNDLVSNICTGWDHLYKIVKRLHHLVEWKGGLHILSKSTRCKS